MNRQYLSLLYLTNKHVLKLKQISCLFSTTKTTCTIRNPDKGQTSEDKFPAVPEDLATKFRKRKPVDEREDEWYSAFRLFAPKKSMSPDIIAFLQSPIDFRPATIQNWWKRKMQEKQIYDQRYIEQRHEILGNDLATAHFVVHRGGSVKFLGKPHWVKKNEEEEYVLPQHYSPDFVIEAIDLSGMDIYYEGFANIVNLKKLKWLSFNGCQYIDEWCIDWLSGEYQDTLEYLDLSNCPLITERALSAMYRLHQLKVLKLNNIVNTKSFELSCLLLEDINPNLTIEGVKYMDLAKNEEQS